MAWQTIVKSSKGQAVAPNLSDYPGARATFSWGGARRELDGLPGGRGLNIAHEAVDRHAFGPRREHLALRWLGKKGEVRDFTYARLQSLTNRFANVLGSLGVKQGDRVYVLAGRIPELYVAALGTLKNRSVFCPLFSAFGPEPIRARLTIGQARVLVTTPSLYQRKVAPQRAALPELEHVLLVGDGLEPTRVPDTRDYGALMADADDHFVIGPTDPEDMALLHFTSGTTGKPKGAVHVHEAVVAHHITGRLALDLHPDDIFWCTADPGWVTGTSYGIIAPLTNGVTSIIDEGDFDAERWYGILQAERVTVWYTAPTAIRMMMKAGADLVRKYDMRSLRFLSSVGEPLNPEAVVWGEEAFGHPFHDNWWQTETGGIMIAELRRHGHPARLHGPAPAGSGRGHREEGRQRPCGSDRAAGYAGRAGAADPAGRPCSATTGESPRATGSASSAVGISPAISPGAMPTGTSGSWDGPMTSSRPPATWSARSRWRAC